MQLRGRTVIIGIFLLALLMAGGAWWRRLEESRHAAEFWGRQGVPLIVGNDKIKFLALGDAPADEAADSILGRPVAKEFDLTDTPGVVHLRYALTQDANFDWTGVRTARLDEPGDWAYALRFADDDRSLTVVLDRAFRALGLIDPDRGVVKIVPSPRLAPKLQKYLTDVKAPLAPHLAPGQ